MKPVSDHVVHVKIGMEATDLGSHCRAMCEGSHLTNVLSVLYSYKSKIKPLREEGHASLESLALLAHKDVTVHCT